MMLRYSIITAIFAACFGSVQAQSADSLFTGYWVGVLTQEPGGMYEEYPFKMNIIVTKDHQVIGRTYSNIYEDPNFANWDFTGTIFKGQLLTFQETKIAEATEMEQYIWCIKGGQLKIKVEPKIMYLDGYWQGVTPDGGKCIPGKIHLKKILDP